MKISKIKIPGIQNPLDIKDTTYQFELTGNTLKVGTDNGTKSAVYTPENMEEITYANLKSKRDNGLLVPGQQYRITDYVTTVNSAWITNARSVEHPFDIIVTAGSTTELNENARAIQHDGDTYFANSNLEAWELKYTLDNINWSLTPTTVLTSAYSSYKFKTIGNITLDGTDYILLEGDQNYQDSWGAHAVCENTNIGTDIYAYYDDGEFSDESVDMIDSVTTVTDAGKGTITWMKDEFNNEVPYDFKNIQFKRWKATDSVANRLSLDGYYMVANPNTAPANLSVIDDTDFIFAYTFSSQQTGGTQTDFSLGGNAVYSNVIRRPYIKELNNIVFYGENNYLNTFDGYCYNDTFGNNCYNNSFGNGCNNSSFGNSCYHNSFGNGCRNNSFGNNCRNNSFGNSCHKNSFGNNCQYNSFVNSCYNNSFWNGCQNNSFGNNCRNNSITDSCGNNTFGNNCQYNSFSKSYSRYIIFENGNCYITLTSTETTSSSLLLRNIKICQGVNNTTTTKTISHNTVNDTFQTEYKPANSQVISV